MSEQQIRPIGEALDEVDREIKVRQRCYARWVSEGKITRTDATDRLERLQAALAYLDRVKQLKEAQEDV